jgi:hypothetical protein
LIFHLAVTSKGLLLNVGEVKEGVAFLGYRPMPDGSRGPSEVMNLVRRHGDIIIAVNGRSTLGKPFKDVIPMLKEASTFSYMRFVHSDCGAECGFTTSLGPLGRFFYDSLSKTYKEDRRRLLAKRSLALIKAEEEMDDDSTSSEDASAEGSDDDSDSDASASGIEPDSEDEALIRAKSSDSDGGNDAMNGYQGNGDAHPFQPEGADAGEKKQENEISALIDASAVVRKQESTRHLAYGLLGLDVGYSSDEGGDEDVAYYVSAIARLSLLYDFGFNLLIISSFISLL